MSRYKSLTSDQKAQLAQVVPSHSPYGLEYRPCRVRLRDGTSLDRVYIVEADSYKTVWGVWPANDPGKRSISIEDVELIEESPYRLPASLADELYRGDETGPGYFEYTVVLADGTMIPTLTGGAVDFPRLPDGVTADEIVDVIRGKGNLDETPPEYLWCLYAEGSSR